jgi:hypothetical protein
VREELPIPFPLGGVSDAVAIHDQTPTTSQLLLNMRGLDPITGRLRGAQRAGISKFVPDQIGASFVQDVNSISYDIDLSTYTVIEDADDVEIEWSKTNSADDITPAIAATIGGDPYIISGGSTIQKYNANGELVLTEQLPLTNSGERATAIAVADDGAVFVSTEVRETEGVERFVGKVFRYEPATDGTDTLERIWTYGAGGRVPDIAYRDGRLAVLVNMEGGESVYRILGSLATDEPTVDFERPVPNPSNKIVFDKDGDVIGCSPPNAARDDVEIPATCGVKTEDWTPNEILQDVHSWHRADDVVDRTENELVDIWLDATGSGRTFFAEEDCAGLRFVSNAICGKPGLRAWGERDAATNLRPGLRSGTGGLCAIPSDNSTYFYTMIIKSRDPANDTEYPNGFHGVIFEIANSPLMKIGQYNGGRDFYFQTGIYLDDTGTNREDELVNDGKFPRTDEVTNDESIVIITWAVDPTYGNADGPDDREGSFIRINGKNHAQYTHRNNQNPSRARIGYQFFVDGTPADSHADFDICEFICVKKDYGWPSNYSPPQSGSSGHSSGGSEITAGFDWEGAPSSGALPSEIELVEGYIAHKYGVQAVLDPSHPYASTAPVSTASSSSGSSSGTPEASSQDVLNFKSPYGIVWKCGASRGDLRWAYADAGVGYGLAVGVDEDDDGVYTTGPTITVGSSGSSSGLEPTVTRRRLVDQGFSVSDQGGDGAWAGTEPIMSSVGETHRIAVDGARNVYIPIADASADLVKIDEAGAVEWSFTGIADSVTGVVAVLDTLMTINDETIGEPEFLYYGADPGAAGEGDKTLYKIRLVDVQVSVGAPRGLRVLAVSEGTIKRLDREGQSVGTPTGGTDALNAGSRVVRSTPANGKLFYIDGERYRYYDPELDEVKEWLPKGSGSMPNRARILEFWRNRVLLARTEGESSNIYASEVGNPFGWDRYPAVQSAKQAWSLAVGEAGEVPDIVNCLIPYSDDLLIIGGDRSIHILRGDPMNQILDPRRGTFNSGQVELISDSVGMAFGRPWCKDETGRIYFFSSRGQVYSMYPGQQPQEISGAIRDRLDGISFDSYSARLVWNSEDRGLHLFFVPIDVVGGSGSSGSSSGASSGSSSGSSSGAASGGSSGAASGGGSGGGSGGQQVGEITVPDRGETGSVEDPASVYMDGDPLIHWFWERDTGAWWRDQFGSQDHDPTSAVVVDGDDAEDRVVLMGCADGYVRFWDGNSANDDGVAVNAFARIGPLLPRTQGGSFRYSGFMFTLDLNQDGAVLGLRGGDAAAPEPALRATKTLTAGRNPPWAKKVKGQSVYLDLQNDTLNERFAIEKMACMVAPAGRVRKPRTTGGG